MQSAVAGSTAVPLAEPEGRGNAGSVESMENQTQVSHAFHRHLKIPRRDFHISTAPAMTMLTELKSKKGSRPLRGLPIF